MLIKRQKAKVLTWKKRQKYRKQKENFMNYANCACCGNTVYWGQFKGKTQQNKANLLQISGGAAKVVSYKEIICRIIAKRRVKWKREKVLRVRSDS